MLEQLKELLEMQRVLDDAILKKHGNVYDEKIAEQIKIALFVELGELMNELPSYFKHWKKTAKDNREKALVEYVDALHFALSLFNYNRYVVSEKIHDYHKIHDSHNVLYTSRTIRGCLENIVFLDSYKLTVLFELGNLLGFTWEEIYEAYKQKNAVNYERLKSNY